MKIGRNDPCSCGSGIKYKKCCMDKNDQEEKESRREDLTPVIRWILDHKELRNSYESLMPQYFTNPPSEMDMGMLLDAFIFDYKLPENGKTPFDIYLEKAKIFPSEREDYEKLIDNVFSAFEVQDVEIDNGMKIHDIINNKTYYVTEKKGTHGATVGNMITCRIAKIGDSFRILGPGVYNWPSEVVYSLKRLINKEKFKKEKQKLSSFDIIKTIHKGEDVHDTLDEAKSYLKEKLESLGLKIDFRELNERINNNTELEKAFPEIYNFNFPSMEDFEETMQLVQELWNLYPRKEFGGKSPEEVSKIGPKEQMIIQTFIREGTAKIDPDNYDSVKDAEEAMYKFQKRWMEKPQKELNGKTPMEAILEERASLGNPSKEMSIRTMLQKLPDFNENKAEKLYFDALAAEKSGNSEESVKLLKELVEIYPENYKAWGNMGASYASLGKKEDSLRCLRKALLINPKYKLAKKNLEAIKTAL